MCGCTGLIDPTDSPAAFPVRPRRSLPADRLPGKAMRHSIQTGWRLPALCAIPHLPVSLSVSCPSNAGQTDMCSPSGPPVDPVNFPSSYHSLVEQCEGRPSGRPPQRDPIFRDAKVLLFWCDQQQKESLFSSIPLCRHIGWVFYPSAQVVSGTRTPLISSPGMVPRGCYK